MSEQASQRVLVTGGTGFIGRYVVESLLSQGVQPIVTTSGEPLAGQSIASNGLVALDLTDPEATRHVIASTKPEIVLHLGGVTGAGTTGERCHTVNFIGTANLLDSLEKVGVSRVILLGTAAEYGPQPTPFREDMPIRPVSPYASSKADANALALDMYSKTGLPVTVLRVFTAYGYGQPRKMFLSQLITAAVLGERFRMSDGLQKRDLVFVGDVSAAILAAMTAEKAIGRAINIAGGRGIALSDLATKIWDICNADPELLEIGSREKTDDDAFDTEADISLAAELLGWRPETPFVGEAGKGHPLLAMIDRMRDGLTAQDISVSVSSRPAQ